MKSLYLNVTLCNVVAMKPMKYKTIRTAVLELSQAELADKIGVTRQCIIRRESGESPISKESALALLQLVERGRSESC